MAGAGILLVLFWRILSKKHEVEKGLFVLKYQWKIVPLRNVCYLHFYQVVREGES